MPATWLRAITNRQYLPAMIGVMVGIVSLASSATPLVVVALIGGLGMIATWRVVAARRRAADATANWMIVRGDILAVDVATQRAVNDQTDYLPRVRYAYRLGGRDWVNDRIRVGGDLVLRDRARAHAIVRTYVAGETVLIHYDPTDPQISALELVPAAGRARQWLVIGCAMLLYPPLIWGLSHATSLQAAFGMTD